MNDPYDNFDFHQEYLQLEVEEMHSDSSYNNSVYYSSKIDIDFPS